MIPGSANPLLLKSAGGYQIERSLRFNSSDSGFCSRTPAVAGSRTTWTWAGWVKRSALGTRQQLFSAPLSSNGTYIEWQNDLIGIEEYTSGLVFKVAVAAVQRDPSAWYHIVFAFDTTIASPSSDRVKIYINGILQTSLSSSSYPSQNHQAAINATTLHKIGAFPNPGDAGNFHYFNGYLADIHFIDGQALTPSSFTEVSATTGQLIPKTYSGSYGTNGFQLKFSDNSSNTAATLGKDTSGNSNNWTPNNLSVTAGAGNDSLVDTPTSIAATDTGVGGEVRGNYCTMNPLSNNINTLANGNLDIASAAGNANSRCNATIGISSGKWYFEILLNAAGTNSSAGIGQNQITSQYPGQDALSYVQELDNARKGNSDTYTAYGSALVAGDVFMCAFDLDNSKIFFGKNGTWFNSSNPAAGTSPAFTLATGTYTPIARPYNSNATGASFSANAGQRAFAYTAPSGFKALCDTNLPAPLVAKPNTLMDVKLYTGNGSTQTISGLGFSPDWVWVKQRDSTNTASHVLIDIVRGNNNVFRTNGTDAENGVDINPALYDGITNLSTSSFDVVKGSSGVYNGTNGSSKTYVAWCWDAGTSTVSNTSGSITSQVRANVSAGFSVVTYTGTGANATVGHGLGVAAGLVIVKRRDTTSNWQVRHTSIAAASSIQLNLTAAAASATTVWNSTAPSSTVFSIGTDATINAGAGTYVAYCFAPVVGYSSMGSYVGNGSADGPFVFTGMRPRWLLFKNSNVAGQYWDIYDTARDTYNAAGLRLFPNAADAESDARPEYDILSNGFKVRDSSTSANGSGNTIIYAAFAENPFQYARAR